MAIDFRCPPARKYPFPLIDAHVHLTDSSSADLLIEIAQLYGVRAWLSVSSLGDAKALRHRHGDALRFALWPEFSRLGDATAFARENSRLMREGVKHGAAAMKFWFKPEFNYEQGLYLDDKRLRPLFEEMEERDLAALVHIADPDVWFRRQYRDESKYLSKRDNYAQLECVLSRHEELKLVAAHFGGDPEDLGHLEEMLNRHANLYIDTSATKWVARELSAQARRARAFILAHENRILFGTDLVTYHGGDDTYFGSRYYVQQHLWEGAGEITSPISDGDARGEVKAHGFALPRESLEKIYHDNAVRVYKLRDLRQRKA